MGVAKASIRKFFREEDGVSSIEYAILASMIIAVCVLAIALLGEKVRGLYEFFNGLFGG